MKVGTVPMSTLRRKGWSAADRLADRCDHCGHERHEHGPSCTAAMCACPLFLERA